VFGLESFAPFFFSGVFLVFSLFLDALMGFSLFASLVIDVTGGLGEGLGEGLGAAGGTVTSNGFVSMETFV